MRQRLAQEDTAQPGGHDLRLVADRPDPGAGDGRRGPSRPSQATRALAMCADLALFRTPDGDPFCRIPVGGHIETWPLESAGFRRWLRAAFFRVEGQALRDGALGEVAGALAGQALFGIGSVERPAPVRLAEHEGAIYVDLCSPTWEQVAITPGGWRAIPAAASPVAFRRTRGLLALPMPVAGGSLDALRRYLNAKDEDAWRLIAAWLVQAMRPSGPYPVLVLSGQQGTAKTTTGRILRALVDPHRVPLRRPPREERELAIAAGNAWVVALDNLSRLPDWLSDGLCCLATGGGFGARALYSDGEEALFSYQRPCLLTSIEDTVERGDLLDRALLVELTPIADPARRTERELWAAFEREHPALLGALLTVVVGALGRVEALEMPAKPRLADFAQWVAAAEPALGWAEGSFLARYTAGRADARVRALDASPLVGPLRRLLDGRRGSAWVGSATALLAALEGHADETTRRRKDWPKGANILSGALRRLAPNLQETGIVYETPSRTGGARPHRLSLAASRVEEARNPPSPPSPAPTAEATPEGRVPTSDDDAHPAHDDARLGHRHGSPSGCAPAPEGVGEGEPTHDGGDDGDDSLRPSSAVWRTSSAAIGSGASTPTPVPARSRGRDEDGEIAAAEAEWAAGGWDAIFPPVPETTWRPRRPPDRTASSSLF